MYTCVLQWLWAVRIGYVCPGGVSMSEVYVEECGWKNTFLTVCRYYVSEDYI